MDRKIRLTLVCEIWLAIIKDHVIELEVYILAILKKNIIVSIHNKLQKREANARQQAKDAEKKQVQLQAVPIPINTIPLHKFGVKLLRCSERTMRN
jgi:hypothetical protein